MTSPIVRTISFFVSIGVGLGVSTGHPFGLAAAAVMPFVCLLPDTRNGAFENTLGYYACGLWPLIPGLQRYIGASAGIFGPFAVWLIAAVLLSLPWAIAWTDRRGHLCWRTPLAMLATCMPPLGIIGFISPLTASGYLFPATGWAGLGAIWLAPGFLLAVRRHGPGLSVVLAYCFITALAGRFAALYEAKPIPGWVTVNTHFGDLSRPFRDYAAAEFIQDKASESSARVLIFPEAIVPRWSETTEVFWRRTLLSSKGRGQILAFGAGLPSTTAMNAAVFDFASSIAALRGNRPLPDRRGAISAESIDNSLFIAGAESAILYQRVPVPIGMWRPFSKISVPLRLSGSGIVSIDSHRAAVLICYEEILTFPVLVSMLHNPSVIIAISNTFWFDNTTIPFYQASALRSWARLFRVPLYMAVNS